MNLMRSSLLWILCALFLGAAAQAAPVSKARIRWLGVTLDSSKNYLAELKVYNDAASDRTIPLELRSTVGGILHTWTTSVYVPAKSHAYISAGIYHFGALVKADTYVKLEAVNIVGDGSQSWPLIAPMKGVKVFVNAEEKGYLLGRKCSLSNVMPGYNTWQQIKASGSQFTLACQ